MADTPGLPSAGDQANADARREVNRDVERAGDAKPIPEDIFPAEPEPAAEQDVEEDGHLTPVRPFVGRVDTVPESQKTVTRIEIPIRTVVTVALSIFGIWVFTQIWPILLEVVLAFMLATAMLPLVKRLENRGMNRGLAAGVVFLMLVAAIVGVFALVIPPFVNQAQNVIDNGPDYLRRMEDALVSHPVLLDIYNSIKDQITSTRNGGGGDGGATAQAASQALNFGAGLLQFLTNAFFVLVLTYYLMTEGGRAWRFLSRYLTPRLRFRMRRAYPDISRVVSGYAVGQLINSTCFATFAAVLLWSLGVPEALLMAVLAFVMDAVPIIGSPAATIPAVLLALTVNWHTALIVLIAYVIYVQFESYILIPRVFGNALSVSALSILVGVLIGAALLGIIGVILALPITAAIPVLERVWNEPLPDDIIAAEKREAEVAERERREQEAPERSAAAPWRNRRQL